MNLPTQAALARYGAVKVTTSTPGQLLVMLYDGLLRFLREARAAMVAKDRARAGERINRAQAIIRHLLGTLDFPQSPQLCERLQSLYLFCNAHLLRANIEQDAEKIGEVAAIVVPLRDAWVQAVATVAATVPK
jgi:flagellar protein FliS